MNINGFLLVFVFLLSGVLTDSAKANELEQQNKGLVLVGQANFSVWFWDIYDIELLADPVNFKKDKAPFTLSLKYHRNISAKELLEETERQWERLRLSQPDKTFWLEQLSAIWPDVSQSDSIAFHVDKNYITCFYYNQQYIGQIEGKEFAIAFSDIWLDPKGPYPKMTRALLGG